MKTLNIGANPNLSLLGMPSMYSSRAEEIYNYIQRPFIHMSWEKEEANVEGS